MSFVCTVTSVVVDDSFFQAFFCFNNINTLVRSYIFSPINDSFIYIQKGPLSTFQPGAPHNLNPPLPRTP